MIKKILVSFIFMSLTFAVYNVGQTVSYSDQNVTVNVCDQTSEYSVGDPIKLADWNGASNSSGDYYVIWLEMSASW